MKKEMCSCILSSWFHCAQWDENEKKAASNQQASYMQMSSVAKNPQW